MQEKKNNQPKSPKKDLKADKIDFDPEMAKCLAKEPMNDYQQKKNESLLLSSNGAPFNNARVSFQNEALTDQIEITI